MMSFKNANNFIIILTLFAFLIRVFPVDTTYFFWDETVYLMNAQYIAKDYVPYSELANRPIFVPFILSFFTQNLELASRIIMALLNSLFVPLIYFFGKELNKKTGLIAAIIITIFPFHILISGWVMTDALAALSFLGTIYFFWIGLNQDKKSLIYLGSLVFGLSILIKFTNLLLFVLLFPFLFYFSKSKIKNKAKTMIISILLFFVPLTFFFLFSYLSFGNPFFILIKAFLFVSNDEPVTLGFTLLSLYDFFGPVILIFFFLGMWFLLKKKNFLSKSFLFWSLILILYYVLLLQKGVAKPPTIEWEVERFLMPALPFVVIISSYAIQNIFKKRSSIVLVLVIFSLLSIPQFTRAYTPSIQFENGLREATKDMGIYIKKNIPENITVHCTHNCPPLAYYSQRKIKIVSEDEINRENIIYLVTMKKYNNLNLKKDIKIKDWTAYLYQK